MLIGDSIFPIFITVINFIVIGAIRILTGCFNLFQMEAHT